MSHTYIFYTHTHTHMMASAIYLYIQQSIICIVVDEAHRATGNHAYCKVIDELAHRYIQLSCACLCIDTFTSQTYTS